MAGKLLAQQPTGPEAELVKDLMNDLVANIKNDLSNGALNGAPDSDHDEQDKDSINNEDDVNDELMHGGELIKHHNGRNSISSGGSSTEERTDDEDELQEYLNRKDTAVVYPVDVCETANQTHPDLSLNKLTANSLLNASDQQPIKRKKNCKYRPFRCLLEFCRVPTHFQRMFAVCWSARKSPAWPAPVISRKTIITCLEASLINQLLIARNYF